MKKKILVIGALGQIGTELTGELINIFGNERIIASDIREPVQKLNCEFINLDVLDGKKLFEVIKKNNVKEIYFLAAILSAKAEQNPVKAWETNIKGLFNVLNIAKEKFVEKVFWPSSIAVFGSTTPKEKVAQYTITEPNTVYGISKLAGERWCEYYNLKYGVDVRSIRYPGLIGYKSLPGGGTTDYAVEIFYEAKRNAYYNCFLKKDTTLPMMYMPDAINATIKLMLAEKEKLSVRSSYNIAAFSFSPEELSKEIKKHIPCFKINYKPDYRQEIASTWPRSIDDNFARKDWNWQPKYNFKDMVNEMLKNCTI